MLCSAISTPRLYSSARSIAPVIDSGSVSKLGAPEGTPPRNGLMPGSTEAEGARAEAGGGAWACTVAGKAPPVIISSVTTPDIRLTGSPLDLSL